MLVLDTVNLFFIFFIINKRIMDLFTIIIIIVFVFIIKYLIDTINSLNLEIREIKEKCISNNHLKKQQMYLK